MNAELIAKLRRDVKWIPGKCYVARLEEIMDEATDALEAAQAEIERLTAELGDLPEAQADMMRTIKELQASLAWITEYIRAAPPELEEAKKWLLAMDNAAAGASPVEPSQALELSDAEIKKISSDLSLYEDYQPESCQADYLDPVKFARAIIAVINAKGAAT